MRACLFLLSAGLMDALLTNLGMVNGVIEEGNPIVKFIIEKSWYLFYLVKISLPLALIVIMFLKPLNGWVRKLITASCIIYLSVLLYHLAWILLYVNSVI